MPSLCESKYDTCTCTCTDSSVILSVICSWSGCARAGCRNCCVTCCPPSDGQVLVECRVPTCAIQCIYCIIRWIQSVSASASDTIGYNTYCSLPSADGGKACVSTKEPRQRRELQVPAADGGRNHLVTFGLSSYPPALWCTRAPALRAGRPSASGPPAEPGYLVGSLTNRRVGSVSGNGLGYVRLYSN